MAGDAPEATGKIAVGGFRTFRYPARAGDGVAETSAVSASEGVCALSATPTDPSTSLRAGVDFTGRPRQTPDMELLVGSFRSFPQAICQSRGTERWRCGRSSRRASMMPILSGWARQTYATTLLRNVKGKMGTMPALRARKIILAYRHGAREARGQRTPRPVVGSFCAPCGAKTRWRGVSGMNSCPALLRRSRRTAHPPYRGAGTRDA